MVVLITTPLLNGAANKHPRKHRRTHLMLRHVRIVSQVFSLQYCTPFILILMGFTHFFSLDDHEHIHLAVFVT